MPRNPYLDHDLYTGHPFDPRLREGALPKLKKSWPVLGYWDREGRGIPGPIHMVISAQPAPDQPAEPYVILPCGQAYALRNDPQLRHARHPRKPADVLAELRPAPLGATARIGDTAYALSTGEVVSGSRAEVRKELSRRLPELSPARSMAVQQYFAELEQMERKERTSNPLETWTALAPSQPETKERSRPVRAVQALVARWV